MNNRKTQTIRHTPASTASVLPPVQRYAPPCRAETPAASDSRITNHASLVRPPAENPPTTDHQLSTNNHQPIPRASKPKARNGKIARLPKPLRDMVNLMLQNNIAHADIADAIQEHGFRVTVRNVSNWKTRGGYNDWRLEQNRIITTRLRQDNLTDYLRPADATHLPEVGLQLTATQLCEFLLTPETQQQLISDPEKFARTISNLCRVTRHLHLLQKYRDDSARELGYKHNPERVKRETDKRLETTRHIYSAEKLADTNDEPDIPHRNFIPKNQFADTAEQEPAPLPVDPLRALTDFASLLKTTHANKP